MADSLPKDLLSELYQKHKGVSGPVLEKYRNLVRKLLAQDQLNQEEGLFINDFLSTIVDIKISVPQQTAESSNGQTQTQPQTKESGSTSASNPNQQHVVQSEKPQVVKLNELVVIPEKFDGARTKARRWLDDYERAAVSNTWNDATKAKYFQAYLTGSATDWFAVLVQSNVADQLSWTQVKDSFNRFYIGKDEDLALERALKDTIQQQNESCSSFIARYARLMKLSDPNVSSNKLINAIRIRLRSEFVKRLASHQLTSLESLNMACASIEDGLMASKAADQLRRGNRDKWQANQGEGKNKKDDKSQTQERSKKQCERCERPGHSKQDCFATRKKDGTELTDKAPKEKPQRKTVNTVAEETDQVTEEEERPNITVAKRCSTIVANSSTMSPRSKVILHDVVVNGQNLKALIDTGSESSIMNAETASMNGWVPKGPAPELAGANSSPIKCFGSVKVALTISIGDTVKTVDSGKFVVAEHLCCDMILGIEMLGWLRILVDPEERTIRFKEEKRNLSVVGEETIPARSQKVISARAPPNAEGVIQTIPFNSGADDLLVANTIACVNDGRVDCLVANLDTKDKVLKEGWQLAGFECLSGKAKSRVNAAMEIGQTESFVTVGDDLSEEQLKELAEMLKEHQEAFSVAGELGCTNALEHDIELVDGAKPFTEPLRRRPLAHVEETRRQITEMLNKGIIEESKSPWAAAYVLAKKKSGEMRLCVDFRRLNDATKKWVYPLPNVEDCVETLAGKRFFSQLDMASGFWQLPLSERAKELTAFRTEDGHYQFTRMPFGLTNAPASFQRLVNVIFSGLKGLHLQVFIDDLCLASSTWEEHTHLLKQVFQLMIGANLKLKSNKCLLAVPRVTFLGHEISAAGVRQDPSKLAAIRDLPRPSDTNGLRSVLGMLNYYRRFVPRFAILTEPMTKLLRKGQKFSWESEQQQSFDTVVSALLANGTLSHFRHNAPTALKTDACKIGIGAILLQQIDDEWRIVTCRSRRLKPNEQNYSVTELEALAIVEAVTKLRNYLLGKQFRIVTDHCALCAVFKNASTNARLNRWRLILQEFQFEVYYTKGSMHADVDCLSRAPLVDETDDLLDNKILTVTHPAVNASSVLVTPIDIENWLAETNIDEEAVTFASRAKHRRDGFKYYKGLLYKNNKLFVPSSKRQQILEAAHSSMTANHGGIRVTQDRLDAFWWPKLQLDAMTFVESCVACQKRKAPRVAPSGTHNSFETHEPLELIAIDCLDLAASLSNRRHVIVAVDVFTRFLVAKAIKALRGSIFTKFLRELVGHIGTPRNIITDNAPFFCNETAKELTDMLKIEHRKSTPHHYQGNAVAERMIQTLQEKLALLVNRPDTSLDWETGLPLAVLSINTATCAATGYSPYELMFGRRHAILPGAFELRDEATEAYLQKRRMRLGESYAAAEERQGVAQQKAKTRYENQHAPRFFDVGERVLTRKMGRLGKLSNRWEGPHSVSERKADDIYIIDTTNGKIERHVSDMKLFKVCLVASVFSQFLLGQGALVFDRQPPILWQETEKYTSPGWTRFKIRDTHASSCPILRQVEGPAAEEMTQCEMRCEQVFEANVGQRIAAFNVQPAPSKSNNQTNYPLQTSNRQNIHYQQSIPQTAVQIRPSYPVANHLARQEVHHALVKREGLSATFATYALVSNVLQTAISRYWPSPAIQELLEHDRQTTKALVEMRDGLNVTQVSHEALMGVVVNQAKLIQHNSAELAEVRYNHPQLMVISAHIVAHLVEYGSLLDRLRISFRSRRPDLGLISQITRTSFLDAVDADSIPPNSVKASSPEPLVFELEFSARERDPSTMVYEVEAFDFWTNLTDEQPVLMRYDGPKFVIHNPSKNCIKGIGAPKHRWVNARCDEMNYEDTSLSKWTPIVTATNPWLHMTRTTVKESWPYVYVYCFPHNVTIGNVTDECPPFVHRINATLRFETSDGYIYSPAAVEFSTSAELVTNAVQAVHFRNRSIASSENEAIRKIIDMRAQLKAANERLNILNFNGGGGISYPQFVTILAGLALCLGLVGLGVWITRATAVKSHREIRRMVTDSVYGSKVYETLERHRRQTPPAQPTTIIHMATMPAQPKLQALPYRELGSDSSETSETRQPSTLTRALLEAFKKEMLQRLLLDNWGSLIKVDGLPKHFKPEALESLLDYLGDQFFDMMEEAVGMSYLRLHREVEKEDADSTIIVRQRGGVANVIPTPYNW